MKILIVTYEFPPAGGVAVQRALSWAKYLPDCGCEVHVLTARNPASPVHDPELLRDVPAGVTIHRAWSLEPPYHFRKAVWKLLNGRQETRQEAARDSRRPAGLGARIVKRLLCPDPEVLWLPLARRRAFRIIEKHGIDTVVVTAPPFSIFLVGMALKKRFPGVQLVSDFRDEWRRFYLSDFAFQGNEWARRRAGEIERATVESSDLVVAVTRTSLAELRRRYPAEPESKFAFIPNGYDPQRFSGFSPRATSNGAIVVTYVGTVYKTSSPKPYLDALDGLPERIRSRFETRFVGRIAEPNLIDGRKSLVRATGFLPHADAVRQMEESDYLLVTMHNDFMLPAKIFEYLAAGKPILALAPQGGEVARLLEETGAGYCADPADPAAIQAMLERVHEQTSTGQNGLKRNAEGIRRYERPRLAAELAVAMRKGQDRTT